MLAIFPKKDKLKVVFIILLAGMFIAAITVIKPFILYVKYINALDQDITYLSAPELDWIAQCSDSVYNPDHNDLLTRAQKNKKVGLITTIFLGIWICYCIIQPVLISLLFFIKSCECSNISQNLCNICSDLSDIIKAYMILN